MRILTRVYGIQESSNVCILASNRGLPKKKSLALMSALLLFSLFPECGEDLDSTHFVSCFCECGEGLVLRLHIRVTIIHMKFMYIMLVVHM